MSIARVLRSRLSLQILGNVTLVIATCALIASFPGHTLETVNFVALGLFNVMPLVLPGVLAAAWITASGANNLVAMVFYGRPVQTVIAATLIGALLPVCGVTVLPMMAGLLAAGVPLAPVMAFWLASPVTGPAMLFATAATLGWEFALGKAAAAVGLGLWGGGVSALLAQREWALAPLRSSRLVDSINNTCSRSSVDHDSFEPWVWRDQDRRARFVQTSWSTMRLILLVLTPAFAAEFLLNTWLKPNAVAAYIGQDTPLAVPIAVFVGGPAYIDGYAALPLTRALLEHGMSNSAAMAFLVSGGVVSIWGALAIFPVLKLRPFLLYLALAASGSMLAGWAFGVVV